MLARLLQGTAVLNTVFKEYGPWAGDINTRELGSLVAFETGSVTGYAIESVQQRGRLFASPGQEVYAEQVGAPEKIPCVVEICPPLSKVKDHVQFKDEIHLMAVQVIGIHQRAGDLKVNVCKKKAVTNMRASGTDNKTPLVEPIIMGLDEALEYIVDDEMVEVTPLSVRIRKSPVAKRPGQK